MVLRSDEQWITSSSQMVKENTAVLCDCLHPVDRRIDYVSNRKVEECFKTHFHMQSTNVCGVIRSLEPCNLLSSANMLYCTGASV